jgi:hypothetical protein
MPQRRPMSAQESTIATLQHQLHQENTRRFEQIERNQDRQQKLLDQIALNTSDLPKLKDRVDGLEVTSDRIKGGGTTIALLMGSWELIRFLLFRK